MLGDNEYNCYHCSIHKVYIYYLKSNNHVIGKYHCWDCMYQETIKKEKYNERANETGHSGDQEDI
jgi:hypothetical protein